jgi:DEAD/DEAH box helicase domain-containing protein
LIVKNSRSFPHVSLTEVYYDVETQLSAEEVGGWGNVRQMRVSIAVSWSEQDGFKKWDEPSMPAFITYLSGFDRVVSFNGDGFDSIVLSSYGDVGLLRKKSFDVLTDLKRTLGHRLRLDSLATATLGAGKTADGLQALKWWKEGKVDLIARYCQDDVQTLVDLVAFGRKQGFVRFGSRAGGTQIVSVKW